MQQALRRHHSSGPCAQGANFHPPLCVLQTGLTVQPRLKTGLCRDGKLIDKELLIALPTGGRIQRLRRFVGHRG